MATLAVAVPLASLEHMRYYVSIFITVLLFRPANLPVRNKIACRKEDTRDGGQRSKEGA
jgi:hypothetical protein